MMRTPYLSGPVVWTISMSSSLVYSQSTPFSITVLVSGNSSSSFRNKTSVAWFFTANGKKHANLIATTRNTAWLSRKKQRSLMVKVVILGGWRYGDKSRHRKALVSRCPEVSQASWNESSFHCQEESINNEQWEVKFELLSYGEESFMNESFKWSFLPRIWGDPLNSWIRTCLAPRGISRIFRKPECLF